MTVGGKKAKPRYKTKQINLRNDLVAQESLIQLRIELNQAWNKRVGRPVIAIAFHQLNHDPLMSAQQLDDSTDTLLGCCGQRVAIHKMRNPEPKL